MLLVYFVTVDLVTSPLITALLRRIAYAIADGKVIKMERLNEYHLRAQSVRVFEENYSYSVFATKLSRSKG